MRHSGQTYPDRASVSGGLESVQPGVGGAAVGLFLWLDTYLVLDLRGATVCLGALNPSFG